MNKEEILQKLKQDIYKSTINEDPNMKEVWKYVEEGK